MKYTKETKFSLNQILIMINNWSMVEIDEDNLLYFANERLDDIENANKEVLLASLLEEMNEINKSINILDERRNNLSDEIKILTNDEME